LADLWFHSIVMLAYFGIIPEDIYKELGKRFGKPKEAYIQNDSK
jgi:phosphoribosyl-ATP pyrophosphohydrolase